MPIPARREQGLSLLKPGASRLRASQNVSVLLGPCHKPVELVRLPLGSPVKFHDIRLVYLLLTNWVVIKLSSRADVAFIELINHVKVSNLSKAEKHL